MVIVCNQKFSTGQVFLLFQIFSNCQKTRQGAQERPGQQDDDENLEEIGNIVVV